MVTTELAALVKFNHLAFTRFGKVEVIVSLIDRNIEQPYSFHQVRSYLVTPYARVFDITPNLGHGHGQFENIIAQQRKEPAFEDITEPVNTLATLHKETTGVYP